MPEQLTDDLYVNAFGEEHAGECVAKRVDAVGCDACACQNPLKRALEVAR